MILNHFLNAKYGLEAIRNRRLKVSQIMDLNDPFEFLGVKLGNREIREAINKVKESMAKRRGILCFSCDWTNPVLWGHYADSNKGICLGFEVDENILMKIDYRVSRLDAPNILKDFVKNLTKETALEWKRNIENQEGEVYRHLLPFMEKLIRTKFVHWKYETEYRVWARLEEEIDGLYFHKFSDELVLNRVIVGFRSDIARAEIISALGDPAGVNIFKAKMAFNSFKVVQDRDSASWE